MTEHGRVSRRPGDGESEQVAQAAEIPPHWRQAHPGCGLHEPPARNLGDNTLDTSFPGMGIAGARNGFGATTPAVFELCTDFDPVCNATPPCGAPLTAALLGKSAHNSYATRVLDGRNTFTAWITDHLAVSKPAPPMTRRPFGHIAQRRLLLDIQAPGSSFSGTLGPANSGASVARSARGSTAGPARPGQPAAVRGSRPSCRVSAVASARRPEPGRRAAGGLR